MPDLRDGEVFHVQGSGSKPYELKNTGGVYSCSCPAWRNQSVPIEQRTCKHLRKLRGDAAEDARVAAAGGSSNAARTRQARPAAASGSAATGDDDAGAPVLLAERWDGIRDLTGWWMSEKLDGVRAYWDGKTLLSRLGNPFHAPDWFLVGLPGTPLDGELWVGRKQFQRAVSIVRRQDRSDLWKEVSFVVFDAPALEAPFEDRLDYCRTTIAALGQPHLKAHEHRPCEGIAALRAELSRLEALGAEGVMLRQPGSRYVAGRSSTLLKVKSFQDGEARVIQHLPGEGRHKGRLGALVVERPDGTRFSVGTGFSDAQRASPPSIGAVITYRYQELSTGGVPRFPSFVGVRDDVRLPESTPAPPTASPVASACTAAAEARRRFEFVEGTSSKFWEVEVSQANVTVSFGRIGTAGQTRTTAFPDAPAAGQAASKLVAEKTAKGYREVKR
jgi:DNA ligase-1